MTQPTEKYTVGTRMQVLPAAATKFDTTCKNVAACTTKNRDGSHATLASTYLKLLLQVWVSLSLQTQAVKQPNKQPNKQSSNPSQLSNSLHTMCCCCPPAINALFCLWLQSGCSKGSVAGALTFFPPDPPLYKFERYDADGRLLSDDDDAPPPQEGAADDDDLQEDEELVEIVGATGHVEPLEEKRSSASGNNNKRSPAQQLTDRARELRKRAKVRNARDAKDAKEGVTYRVALDPRLSRPPSGGTVEAVKILAPNGVYIASLIYRVPANQATSRTKTIIYSHGNATDIGAMFSLQAILVQSLECNVVCYDYSGYGESGGVAQENATYTDIKAVYTHCAEHVSTNPANIILYGQSVGSGPVCHLGYKNNDIGGIILHSPFTSGMRVLTPSRYVFECWMWRRCCCLHNFISR
jgi:hypothetical protein